MPRPLPAAGRPESTPPAPADAGVERWASVPGHGSSIGGGHAASAGVDVARPTVPISSGAGSRDGRRRPAGLPRRAADGRWGSPPPAVDCARSRFARLPQAEDVHAVAGARQVDLPCHRLVRGVDDDDEGVRPVLPQVDRGHALGTQHRERAVAQGTARRRGRVDGVEASQPYGSRRQSAGSAGKPARRPGRPRGRSRRRSRRRARPVASSAARPWRAGRVAVAAAEREQTRRVVASGAG